MRHKESDLQIRCVRWFRITYPAFARLLEHPKNEGHDNSYEDRRRTSIAKKEGVVAGVADLLLHVPSVTHMYKGEIQEEAFTYHSLAIEMKTKTGRQSPEQKLFQRYFEAACGLYIIVRSFDDFVAQVSDYMSHIPSVVRCDIEDLHSEIERERTEAARAELNRIINK